MHERVKFKTAYFLRNAFIHNPKEGVKTISNYKKKKALATPMTCKGFIQLAERVRFELTVLAYTRFPSVRLKPLGHLSGGML